MKHSTEQEFVIAETQHGKKKRKTNSNVVGCSKPLILICRV